MNSNTQENCIILYKEFSIRKTEREGWWAGAVSKV